MFGYWHKLIILFSLYVLTGSIGLRINAVSGFATLVWLPTGLSLAALFLFGYRLWPAVMGGAFLVNFLAGAPILVASGIAVGNTLEAVVGMFLLKKADFKPSLERIRDVGALIFLAGVVSTVISATVGVTSLLVGELVTKASYFATWSAWWMGDLLSDTVFASLIFVWKVRPSVTRIRQRFLEAFAIIFLIVILSLLIFSNFSRFLIDPTPLVYFLIPFLILLSFRFKQREVVTAIFLISAIAISGTLRGYGPFIRSNTLESLFFLQGFVAVISITYMILSAAITERNVLEGRKNDYISMASHELKTPITSIKSYLQIMGKKLSLRNKTNRISQKYFLARMNEQVDRLTLLVNDLLDSAQMQTGRLEFSIGRFDFDKFMTEQIKSFRNSIISHRIIFSGKVRQKIMGDEYRLSQVMANLLANAVKYSPKSDRIFVKVSKEKGDILVSVQDFGIGISEEDLPKIFDPFYRVEKKLAGSFPSYGLGLSISEEIIKRHGGKIWAHSKIGQGSIFFFTIPAKSNNRNL